MNLTGMTEPASEVTGEALLRNVSLVLRKIADTPVGIGEEQLAALSRLLVRGHGMFGTGAGSSGQDLVGTRWRQSRGGAILNDTSSSSGLNDF